MLHSATPHHVYMGQKPLRSSQLILCICTSLLHTPLHVYVVFARANKKRKLNKCRFNLLYISLVGYKPKNKNQLSAVYSIQLITSSSQENKFLSRKCLPSYRQMLTEISGYSSLNCYLAIKAYVNTSSMPRALHQVMYQMQICLYENKMKTFLLQVQFRIMT